MNEIWQIKAFANLCGVSIRTLQYYDKKGLLLPKSKANNGYRYYSIKELTRFHQIKVLQDLGFNLSQIKQILESTNIDLTNLLKFQLSEINGQIIDLQNKALVINEALIKLNTTCNNTLTLQLVKLLSHKSKFNYWFKTHFNPQDLDEFINIALSPNNQSELWPEIFKTGEKLLKFPENHPRVLALAKKALESANGQYESNLYLRNKMWELMKSGDIPPGLIIGYNQLVVLMLDRALKYLRPA